MSMSSSSFSERRAEREETYFPQTLDKSRLSTQLQEVMKLEGRISGKENPLLQQTIKDSLEFLDVFSRRNTSAFYATRILYPVLFAFEALTVLAGNLLSVDAVLLPWGINVMKNDANQRTLFFDPTLPDSPEDLRLKFAIYKLLKTFNNCNRNYNPVFLSYHTVIQALQEFFNYACRVTPRERYRMFGFSKTPGFVKPLEPIDPIIARYNHLEKLMVDPRNNLAGIMEAMKIWLQALISRTIENRPSIDSEQGLSSDAKFQIRILRRDAESLESHLQNALKQIIIYQSWGNTDIDLCLSEIQDLLLDLAYCYPAPEVLHLQATALAGLTKNALLPEPTEQMVVWEVKESNPTHRLSSPTVLNLSAGKPHVIPVRPFFSGPVVVNPTQEALSVIWAYENITESKATLKALLPEMKKWFEAAMAYVKEKGSFEVAIKSDYDRLRMYLSGDLFDAQEIIYDIKPILASLAAHPYCPKLLKQHLDKMPSLLDATAEAKAAPRFPELKRTLPTPLIQSPRHA